MKRHGNAARRAAERQAMLKEVERDLGRRKPGLSKVRGFDDTELLDGPPPHDPRGCYTFGCDCWRYVDAEVAS